MIGTIKSFSRSHGYGFIEAGDDYFFHATEWQSVVFPKAGDRVEFDTKESRKGVRAINVRRLADGK